VKNSERTPLVPKKNPNQDECSIDIVKLVSERIEKINTEIKTIPTDNEKIESLNQESKSLESYTKEKIKDKPKSYADTVYAGITSMLWEVTVPAFFTNTALHFIETSLKDDTVTKKVLIELLLKVPSVVALCFLVSAAQKIVSKKDKTWTEAVKEYFEKKEFIPNGLLATKFGMAHGGHATGENLTHSGIGAAFGDGLFLVATADIITILSHSTTIKEKCKNLFSGKTDKKNDADMSELMKEIFENMGLCGNVIAEALGSYWVTYLGIEKLLVSQLKIKKSDFPRRTIAKVIDSVCVGAASSTLFSTAGQLPGSTWDYVSDTFGFFKQTIPEEKKLETKNGSEIFEDLEDPVSLRKNLGKIN
jgi:hypothetical protein